MGDLCDHKDIDRFIRSPEGRKYLTAIRRMLKGKRIGRVTFRNATHHVEIGLHLVDGGVFRVTHTSLDVEALRDRFKVALDREYLKDHPEPRRKQR